MVWAISESSSIDAIETSCLDGVDVEALLCHTCSATRHMRRRSIGRRGSEISDVRQLIFAVRAMYCCPATLDTLYFNGGCFWHLGGTAISTFISLGAARIPP
jgi:hypothetical protein